MDLIFYLGDNLISAGFSFLILGVRYFLIKSENFYYFSSSSFRNSTLAFSCFLLFMSLCHVSFIVLHGVGGLQSNYCVSGRFLSPNFCSYV